VGPETCIYPEKTGYVDSSTPGEGNENVATTSWDSPPPRLNVDGEMITEAETVLSGTGPLAGNMVPYRIGISQHWMYYMHEIFSCISNSQCSASWHMCEPERLGLLVDILDRKGLPIYIFSMNSTFSK